MIYYRVVFALLAAFQVGLMCSTVGAAIVSEQEAAVDAIFSQAAFGNSPIDIRYAPVVHIASDDLLSVDSAFEFLSFRNLVPSPDNGVESPQLFFVDAVNACGTTVSASFVGCSTIGSVLNNSGETVFYAIVESDVAAGALGAELIAHELTHSMGLGHSPSGLTGEFLDGDTTLTIDEVNVILSSPLVQVDASGQRFIEVTPVLVAPVPESDSLGVLGMLGMVFAASRRRKR